MAPTLLLRHERIDDVPLIIGLANQLRWPEGLDRHRETHGRQQGRNNGQLAGGWWADLLSRADHRKSAVRDGANSMPHTLEQLGGQPMRAVECSDDRLGGVVHRLGTDEPWAALARELGTATVMVYAFERTGIRLDRTTSYGYHQVTEAGGRQRGHSQGHRPDLPQWQRMAAAAEPSGPLSAGDVQPGQAAADPLYTPLLQRVRGRVGRRGLL
jgi:transposase